MNNMVKDFYDSCLLAGIPVVSTDECCQLLAWLSVYGSENAACVLNRRLNNAIHYAQKRLNIVSGGVPDVELLPVLQDYIKSIKDYDNPPDWVIELEKKYEVKSCHKRSP